MGGQTQTAIDAEVRARIGEFISSRNVQCWNFVFEAYKLQIFNGCRAILSTDEDARDLTSDAFIKAIEKIDTYDRNRPFFPWLLRLAKNLCIDHIRKSGRIRLERPEDWEKIGAESVPEAEETDPSRVGRIRKAILQLKKPQKVCFCLFYMHDKSYREIVRLTGYTYDEVRSHIQNGRRNFKLLME
jgi:RNA polymerase sigma factor (sigma-70 family)